jgi:hypothetical protein
VDINKKIKLTEFESINSINEDNSVKLTLDYSNKSIKENNINNFLDVTNQFDLERQTINIYRIHGQLQFFSILNNLRKDYRNIQDFFTKPFLGDDLLRKDIKSQFRFYLVKPIPPSGYRLSNGDISTGYDSIGNNRYIRKFEVIKTSKDFDFEKAGFAKNIFNEQQYGFTIFGDIDLNDQVDGFNFPLSEIFIYAQYIPSVNGDGVFESVRTRVFDSNGNDSPSNLVGSFPLYEVGDVISGDVLEFNAINYLQSVYNEKDDTIVIPYNNATNTLTSAFFNYNPFISVRLRFLSDDLQRVSLSSTDYQRKQTIPTYAIDLGGDNFVWRDLLDKGFLDPLSEEGVNYPFINQRHYIFINQVLSLESLGNTNVALLGDTIFDNNSLLQNNPTSDLNKIGKKC